MGWWSNLLRRPGEKANPVGSLISGWMVGQPVGQPALMERRFECFADEAYIRNAVAFRCTKLITTAAATAPWILHSRGGAEVKESPLLDLLERPAPMVGGSSLFEAFYAYLLLAGTSYLVGERLSGNRPPKELWNLRPDRTSVIAGRFGIPSGYQYEANGQKRIFQCDEITGDSDVLQVKEFHPLNDWYGMSRVEPAAYGVDRHNAASMHNKALLDNGARPTGALVFEPVKVGPNGEVQTAPEAVIKKAEEQMADKSGMARRGEAFVFGGNVRWEEMGISPRDMDFGAGKDDAARDICLSFGVPHTLIVPGQSTYNNVSEAKLELWEDTVLPLLDKATDALNAWLVPRFGDGLRLSVDLDQISALEPRRESKRKSTVELLKEGVIDADEARDALQYGPRKAEAVKKVEAPVVTALLAAAKAGTYEPLYRYLRAAGLLEPDTTLETFQADLDAGIVDEAALLAASTPNGQPNNNNDPGAQP